MNFQEVLKSIATLGPLGYIIASGTIGSFVALFAVFLLHTIDSIYYQMGLIILATIIALIIIEKTYKNLGSADPREIILDEVIGCLIAFHGLPLDIFVLITGFIIFRFLDISKFFGIAYIERYFNGSWSILLDDVAAAILTNIIVRSILPT